MRAIKQAGQLDRKVHLIKPVYTQDDYGGPTIASICKIAAWANKQDTINRQMKEDIIGEQLVAHGQAIFSIRYNVYKNNNVDETWLIEECKTGLRYAIEGITEDGRYQWAMLHCVRKDNL